MKPTYEDLLKLNPYLENKNKKDVEELIDTILECGYVWNIENNEFWHPKIKKGIKTSGLDMFTAERLKETFESAWNNPIWQKESELRKTCVKFFFLSILLFLFSLISFLFLDWKISLAGVVISIVIATISEKIKIQSLKREEKREENDY
jgi:ABC-type multidrug transport system fused ATPase/permease subunit